MSKQKKTFVYTTCSELVVFMYWTGKSMNNLLSYCGLVDSRICASDKDLTVPLKLQMARNFLSCKADFLPWQKNIYLISANSFCSFLKVKIVEISYSFQIMVIFYFMNWIVAAETIKEGKLFKGGNYSRKYGSWKRPKVAFRQTVAQFIHFLA